MAESATVARRPRDRALGREETRATRGFPGKKILGYALLILLSLLYIAPLLWMISTSFKTTTGATAWPVQWIPEEISTQGYNTIFTAGAERPVLRWFLNSLVAATLHALLVLAVATPAGYALARMDFRGRRLITALIIGTIFVPPVIFLVPNFLIADAFGMVDTLAAVIIPYAGSAFGVFFMRQFFQSLPYELEEAALVDGASRWEIFRQVVLPLSKPALATLAVLSFLTNWNDFLWPIYVLLSAESYTLPPGLSILQGAYRTDFPVVMAGGVLASVPVLALFVLAQRYVVEGVARSGIKG